MCDPNAPGGSYCVQHNQWAFTVLMIAGAFISVAVVILLNFKFGVKRTFAILTVGLRPRPQHRREELDAANDLGEESGIGAEEARIIHEQQQQEERQRSAETGIAQWQVRVEPRTHHDTVALAQRLSAEGQSISKGWKFVVVGANCQDDAHRLAETIRMYTTTDAKIHVRPNIPVGGGIPPLAGQS